MLKLFSVIALLAFGTIPDSGPHGVPLQTEGRWGATLPLGWVCKKCDSGFCLSVDDNLCDQQGPTWCVGTTGRCEGAQIKLDGTVFTPLQVAMQQEQSGLWSVEASGIVRNCADQVVSRRMSGRSIEDFRRMTAQLTV